MGLRRHAAITLAVGAIWLGVITTAQEQEQFTTRLSSVAMNLAMREAIAGQGAVTAVLTGTRLSIDGSFEGLRTPATGAQLYRGRVTGLRGSPLFDLDVTLATSGTIMGSVNLSTSQVTSLRSGELYVQLDSEKAPDGNLWGWLLPPEEPER